MSDELQPRDFARTWTAADVTVADDGAGRTVQALVSVFDTPTEVRDAEGHYSETIGQTAFNKTLAERGLNFQVLYNHGRTLDGRPDGNLMVPIGVPKLLAARTDGLYSETEFLDNPLANAVLDGIKKGAIRGYSFFGRWVKSQRTGSRSRADLPTIHRSEIAMREYGPGLFPVYDGAQVLGVRAQSFVDELRTLDPDDLDAFRNMLGIATPLGADDASTTPPGAGQPTRDPAEGQSDRQSAIRARIAARNRARGVLK